MSSFCKGGGVAFKSDSNEWATPQELFEKLNEEFKFTLDPASTDDNAKCEKHYTKEDDGLSMDWGGERVFCNPPYGSEIKRWVKKAAEEAEKPNTCVVLLIPARTDTSYFHDYLYGRAELRFIRGRVKFIRDDGVTGSAPFPSMIAILRSRND